MSLAPLLDPFHVGGIAKVIPIGGFAQPAPLTGSLAGAAAIRGQTVKLAAGIMPVRREEMIAASALAAVALGTHRAPSRKKIRAPLQSKTVPPAREEPKKKEELSCRKREENPEEENGFSNSHLSPTFIPPLTEREAMKADAKKKAKGKEK